MGTCMCEYFVCVELEPVCVWLSILSELACCKMAHLSQQDSAKMAHLKAERE